MSAATHHPTRHWHALEDGRIQCDVCPRDCRLQDGQRGMCFVRMREGDGIVLTTYGRSSGFCVDPVEKKPLYHFHPGSSVLSFGTAGCNLACRFCQNHDISKSREMDTLADEASPDLVARRAAELGCRSVAFTYNDPTIFLEYAMDVADACRERSVASVAVTAGYMHDAPRREFYAKMDAANVDLKGFTDEFYFRTCAARLQPVLDTLKFIRHETSCWLEITTLLIPGLNDGEDEVRAECRWIRDELGTDVPVHFTAFHPDYKMLDIGATPHAILSRARRIAIDEGLQFAYAGNVHDVQADTTTCPGCGLGVIVRDWYEMLAYRLDDAGRCQCGTRIPGRFGIFAGAFGRRRLPVRLAGGSTARREDSPDLAR